MAPRLKNNPLPDDFESRPRGMDADRRASILDCADQLFLEEGFQGASMSAIAARAGGSKGTLYNYFQNKEELFLACAGRHCDNIRARMSSLLAEGGNVREALTRLGRGYLEIIMSDTIVRRFRLIVAEADRSPDLSSAFYENGPARGTEVVAAYLEQAMARGELKRADAHRAALLFTGLCTAPRWKARLCNSEPEPNAAVIADDVNDAVRVFLAAYGVKPT